MRNYRAWTWLAIALVLALVSLPAAFAQEPEVGELEAADISAQAAPSATMNYQGYLTDAGGTPLNGAFDMTFSAWTAPLVGVKAWGDESHPGVTVTNGQFSVVLGETVPLSPKDDFNQQLYLEVTVDGTVLPRQALRAVPYAMGIVASARATGSVPGGYALYAVNTSSTGSGGLYADAFGAGGRSIYSADVTYSSEGYAGPDTYVWVPAMNATVYYIDRDNAHIEVGADQTAIESDGSNNLAAVSIPLQLERPYGRNYQLVSATVYYKVDSSAFISVASIHGYNFGSGTFLTIAQDGTDHSATTFSSFSISPTNNAAISTTTAPTGLSLLVWLPNPDSTVFVYGVRLRLSSDY